MNLEDLIAEAAAHHRSTPDLVATVLREAILSGRLAEEQPLRQDELAAQLGTSKIPIREALRRLESEGLVLFTPNRGAVVVPLSAAEAWEITEMRVVLEGLVLRRALPHLTRGVLGHARAVLDELDEEPDVSRWSTLNWEFHATLYTPAQRPRVMVTLRTLHTNVERYMRLVLDTMAHQDQSQQEHRALLAACERHDQDAAITILSRHIEFAGTMLVRYLEERTL